MPKSAKLGVAGVVAVVITGAVLLPMARTENEKAQPGEHSEAKQIEETPNTVTGIVTDEIRRPRDNVLIAASSADIRRGMRSDKYGRFTLKDVKPDQKQWIAYSQASEAMGFFAIDENYDGRPIHVILNLTKAEAEGRVVGVYGKGLADKKVELVIKTKNGVTYYASSYRNTDKYGYYTVSPVPCGAGLTVQAKLADSDETGRKYITKAIALSDNQIFIDMPMLVVGGEEIQPDFDKNLASDGRVLYSGRVLNEKGKPIAGVRVEPHYTTGGMGLWSKEVMTDEQGCWSRRLPADHSNLSIRFLHPDYISFHFEQSSRRPSPAELRDGSSVMVMKRGLRISGTVLNQQGEPIENALVATGQLYSSREGKIIEDCTTARTLNDGSFSVGGLPERKIDISVSAVGYAPGVVSVEIEEDMKPIEVILKSGRTYIGQVVDAEGKPLKDFKISCHEWKLGKERRRLGLITRTDAEGYFHIEDIPDEGTLRFTFNGSKTGYQVFGKEMPGDLSEVDRIVVYKSPVIAGKVIDADTEEPITSFEVISGIKSEAFGDSIDWSRYKKRQVNSPDGTFSKKWRGYYISYPFDGACYFKIVAKGYLPGITPAVKLGKKYEPFVIRLSKAEPLKGMVIDPEGNPAVKAEVALVVPGKKAFIKNGKFDPSGSVDQAEYIVETDPNGQFELNPSKEQGLIVAVHKNGYARIKSSDYENASEIKLTAWAKIEGTIDLPEAVVKSAIVRIQPIEHETDPDVPSIYWFFDEISVTGDTFNFDYLPPVPLLVGRVVRRELTNATYLKPEPGKSYKIHIGGNGRTVKGTIVCPMTEDGKPFAIEFSNPRRVHVAAYRIAPKVDVPAEMRDAPPNAFLWLWQDTKNVYEMSKTFQKKFMPTIEDNGNFRFDNTPPGKYEFVINFHAPLGENVSCGRGVLKAVGTIQFTVDEGDNTEPVQVPDVRMKLLTHPEVGDPAPLFETKTLGGKKLKLSDYRGKYVLLDFWATWCVPCAAEIPHLKEIYDTFGKDERFVMVGLSLDWDLRSAQKSVKRNNLKWIQGFLGDMSKSTVVKEYGIGGIPANILIGPDGRIIAKSLSAEQLKSVLAKVLGN